MSVQRKYIMLCNENSELDTKTGIWKFKLPEDFVNSRSPVKSIKLINFLFYCASIPNTAGINTTIDFTTLHSPTLCDGNYNQDYYIATLCYTYNTYHKIFPIKTQPQYLEFYFKDTERNVTKKFHFAEGESGYDNVELEMRFTIDLELCY